MKQKIFAVAAMGKNRVLGRKGLLPWPEMKCDYERLSELAGNKPCIMGRNSYETPDRFLSKDHNLILTSQKLTDLPANCTLVSSLEEAFQYYQNEPEIVILGGQMVFELFLPSCTHLYLTVIDTDKEGDAYFPEFSEEDWVLVDRQFFHSHDGNPLDYEFLEYHRKTAQQHHI